MDTRWLVVVATAGGCVPVPPYRGDQPALLTVKRDTGEVASTTSAPVLYAVKFAEHGARMPEAIQLDGAEILKGGACGFEGGVGINVYPAFTASAPALGGGDAPGTTGTLAVDWAGPVIARVSVEWSSAYACSGGSQQASGTSTFTLFPNGRIARHDAAKPSTTALTVDGSPCGCNTDDKLNFSSFWSFLPAARNVLPDGAAWSDGTSALGCAVYPDHTIGVALADPSHARLSPVPGISAFVYDWARDAATVAATERTTSSAIVLSRETQGTRCGEVVADLAAPPLTIGSTAGIHADDNGIYPGPARQATRYDISSPVGIPRGFAVSLDLGGVPVVERTPAMTGEWYAAQAEGDRILLWFRDGLAVGDKITIVPQ